MFAQTFSPMSAIGDPVSTSCCARVCPPAPARARARARVCVCVCMSERVRACERACVRARECVCVDKVITHIEDIFSRCVTCSPTAQSDRKI